MSPAVLQVLPQAPAADSISPSDARRIEQTLEGDRYVTLKPNGRVLCTTGLRARRAFEFDAAGLGGPSCFMRWSCQEDPRVAHPVVRKSAKSRACQI